MGTYRQGAFRSFGAAPWWAAALSVGVFGDSIAAGHNGYITAYEAGGPSGDVTYTPAYQLDALYPAGFSFLNAGVGSTYVSGANYSAIASAGPVAAILHSGINDVANLRTWATHIEPALNTILAAMPAGTHLFVDEILPWTAGNDTRAGEIRTINGQIATWCTDNGATRILCHDAMGQTRVSTGQLDNLLTAYNDDNIHPNAAGYVALAALWQTALEAYY